jgi:hypothetical protein
MIYPKPSFLTRSGSALVATLLVIVVLTIIVTAFLQSMTIERQTAHSYLNRYQAQLAADAAVDYAKNLIYTTISDDKAKIQNLDTYNRRVNFLTWAYSPNTTTFAPFYTGILSYAVPTTPNQAGQFGINNVLRTVWLASDPVNSTNSAGNPTANLSDPDRFTGLPADQKFNINFKLPTATATANASTIPTYWIDQSGASYPVGWVDMPLVYSSQKPTAPELKIRYAFWVDDEMGRADLGQLGNSTQTVSTAASYKPLPGNLVIDNSSGNDSVSDRKYFTDSEMSQIVEARDTSEALGTREKLNKLTLSPGTFKQYLSEPTREQLKKDGLAYTVRDEASLIQPLSTAPSVFDLIPYGPMAGYQKRNLNTIVAQSISSDQRIKQIHDYIGLTLPQYFRRKNSPPGNVWRISAAIHDYIDPALYPTLAPTFATGINGFLSQVDQFVNGSGPRPTLSEPEWETIDLNNRWYGIKRGPYINGIKFSSNPIPSSSGSTTTFTPTYGVYLWNPSDQNIPLNNVSLCVFNTGIGQPTGGGATSTSGRSVDGLPYFRYDIIPITAGATDLAPRELRLVNFIKTYSINQSVTKSSITGGNRMGFILCLRDAGGTLHALDGYFTTATFNFATSSAGGEQTGAAADPYWDVKDRRQTLALRESDWKTAATPATPGIGGLANFQTLGKWYDQPYPASSGPTSPPITSIAYAPMKSLGELGNIFDPINDFGVYAPGRAIPATHGELDEQSVTYSGTRISRGGKTLNVGQFDDFFDRYLTGAASNTANPMASVASSWTSYEKYLRFADSVLFDIFTVKTPAESRASRLLNINTPRPFDTGTPDTKALSPASTYLESVRGLLPMKPSGTAASAYNYTSLMDVKNYQTLVRERLSGPSWKNCLPFRTMSDLTLLGVPKLDLGNDLKATRKDGNTSKSSIFSTTSASSARFLIKGSRTAVATLGTDFAGPNGSRAITIFGATNKDRQAAFGRLAEQVTFRSYRYRIYAVGQVYRDGQPNRPLATVYQTYIYDLNPIYDPTNEPAMPTVLPGPSPAPTPPDVILHPKLQKIFNE